MAASPNNPNLLPPSLISSLQDAIIARRPAADDAPTTPADDDAPAAAAAPTASADDAPTVPAAAGPASKPVVLVTNGEGIDAPGLRALVEALVRGGHCDVHVCAPESDKSVSGHSLTSRETLVVSSVDIKGANAFEVSGTPADCVSLALSGALFSWSKPVLVISGIDKGSSYGNHIFYLGVVAGAREALICGIPSLSISLSWKKDESQESYFKDAVDVCLPLIQAALRDAEKGSFPSCSLIVEIPTCPSESKGFKVTKSSLWRSMPSWQAVSGNKNPVAGQFMSKHPTLGIQLAQLSRDASAAGAARRISAQRKTVEIESIGEHDKPEPQRGMVKKYFRMEWSELKQESTDEELDCTAVENGFVAVTPLCLPSHNEVEKFTSTSAWLASAFSQDE